MKKTLTAIFLVLAVATRVWGAASDAPAWARDAVFYQIYPERFRNGDKRNDPTPAEIEESANWKMNPWTADWFKLQDWEKSRNNFYDTVNRRRFGGDLQGLIDKLDYLSELGITAIYLNPVFEAFSHHKYDGSTYHHIDNNFGPEAKGDLELMRNEDFTATKWEWSAADKLFLKFIQAAHQRKMRVIIDGVFNHVGTRFPPFQDVVKNQQKSKYASWFDVRAWDDPTTPKNEFDYKGWWNLKSLPEFKEDENGLVAGPRAYVFAITRRWMDPNGDGDPSDGVDGWRLDVAADVGHPFWREWRQLVKSINAQAFLAGEIWDDATAWLKGDEFDSVMNYRFAKASVRFFIDTNERHLTVSGFDHELAEVRKSYPEPVNYALWNLYDSHDTDRLASMIKNPNREYDHYAGTPGNKTYNVSKPTDDERAVQKLMSVFQVTYLGAPLIYYGTEAGMWGGDDPDDRKPMVWADLDYEPEATDPLGRPRSIDPVKFDAALFKWYQRLIQIRSAEVALRRGSFETVATDDQKQIYAFKRTYEKDTILVVLNNSSSDQSFTVKSAPLPHRDLLTGNVYQTATGDIALHLNRKEAVILKRGE